MTHTQPLVSVNVVTYNALHWLERCFSSLFSQTYSNIAVTVIDNASTDGTPEALRVFLKNHPAMRVISSGSNLGFAKGHNRGIKETNGELVCLLNQDIVLDENFVAECVRVYNAGPTRHLGAIQGKLFRLGPQFEKTHVIDTTGLEMLSNRRIVNRGQGEIDGGAYSSEEEIFGADGALPMYVREALEDVRIPTRNGWEYFDEDFFMYKEDVDLAWRLRLFGWNTVFVPSARAWHARGAGEAAARSAFRIIRERRKVPGWSKYYSWKNQRLMQIKNETVKHFFADIVSILWKEIRSLGYIVIFEPKNLKAIPALAAQLSSALRKRSYIMKHKRASTADMKRWFK